MNYLIKTTSRARFSTWAAVKSCFFAAESWARSRAESSLVLSWHFSIAYKGIKRKKKKLAWGTELCLGNCFHCMQISKITLRLYSYISTLWDVLSITTDILFKSSSSELSMGRRKPNYKSLTLLPEHHQTSRYPYKGSSWVFSN